MMTKEAKAQIGRNIRGEMARQRKTQKDAARVLELKSQGNVSERLNGDTALRIDEALTLMAWLGMSFEELMRDVPLPRLDSNQEPAGYTFPRILDLAFTGTQSSPPVAASKAA